MWGKTDYTFPYPHWLISFRNSLWHIVTRRLINFLKNIVQKICRKFIDHTSKKNLWVKNSIQKYRYTINFDPLVLFSIFLSSFFISIKRILVIECVIEIQLRVLLHYEWQVFNWDLLSTTKIDFFLTKRIVFHFSYSSKNDVTHLPNNGICLQNALREQHLELLQ